MKLKTPSFSITHTHINSYKRMHAPTPTHTDTHAYTHARTHLRAHKCAKAGIVNRLIQAHVTFDSKDNEGRTALHFAATRCPNHLVTMLVACGAKTRIADKVFISSVATPPYLLLSITMAIINNNNNLADFQWLDMLRTRSHAHTFDLSLSLSKSLNLSF
jgi:hypothetical protein